MEEIILKTNDLTVDFKVRRRLFQRPSRLSAVQNVNLQIRKGEIYGLAERIFGGDRFYKSIL